MPAEQPRRHRAGAEVIVKMPDETRTPTRTRSPSPHHVHLESVAVDNRWIERVDRAIKGGAIPNGARGAECDLHGETDCAPRAPGPGGAVFAEPRDRWGERQNFSGHAKRPDAASQRPVGRGEQMQRPRRLGVSKAREDVDEVRFRPAQLAGWSEEHDPHGVTTLDAELAETAEKGWFCVFCGFCVVRCQS